MIGITVSRRYAKALVKLLQREDELETVGRYLRAFHELLEASSELRAILLNPSIAMVVKRNIQRELLDRLQPPPLARQFLDLLLEKNRLRYLGTIVFLYDQLVNERLNRIYAKVTTRYPLAEKSAEEMRRRLSEVTGKSVILRTEIDERMLGGVLTEIGGIVLDGSVRGHLRAIRDELVRSAS
ncbi:MAG: ATP synthase F1 subunit delta [Candidatus Tectomicrobia bacterium]|nr:ATP synthase F1 subunit delta [Candidatus Tectomicrobia bacterium]